MGWLFQLSVLAAGQSAVTRLASIPPVTPPERGREEGRVVDQFGGLAH